MRLVAICYNFAIFLNNHILHLPTSKYLLYYCKPVVLNVGPTWRGGNSRMSESTVNFLRFYEWKFNFLISFMHGCHVLWKLKPWRAWPKTLRITVAKSFDAIAATLRNSFQLIKVFSYVSAFIRRQVQEQTRVWKNDVVNQRQVDVPVERGKRKEVGEWTRDALGDESRRKRLHFQSSSVTVTWWHRRQRRHAACRHHLKPLPRVASHVTMSSFLLEGGVL